MKLTIFSRMVISLLAIFILSMAACVYCILQLRQLEDLTKAVIRIDARSIILEQDLLNTFLSMMRYERKYFIIKDEGLYKQYLLVKADFDKYLGEITSVASTAQSKKIDSVVSTAKVWDLLTKIKQNYEYYQVSVTEEINHLRSGEDYDGAMLQKGRDRAAEDLTENLNALVSFSRAATINKVKQLGDAEGRARKAAIGISVAALVAIIVISIMLTLNITHPLSAMKKKTREIAKGNFGHDLKLPSPPEIQELVQSFNVMCGRLKEIDKIKSDFLALMSHELRTPLTSIKEGASLLIDSFKDTPITANQKKLLTIISEESLRLIKLVSALLDLAKMEAGMMSYNFTRTDITALIGRAVREIEPLAETKHIKVTIKAGNGFLPIRADHERILQVLRNLIGNAVKFTPDNGSISVVAQPVARGVQVSVTDTGVGIAKENLQTIFNKFQQDTASWSSKVKGTGLGLSIVKHIVESHGGTVWAESKVGQGSTFVFVLPA
jgi:two-component system sensor histidine kinase GlrK